MRTVLRTMTFALVLGSAAAAAEKATVTGVVGDAMCGVKHAMGGDDADCTRECVKQGSDYALIADGKAITLKTDNDSTKAQLDKLAGKKAKVTGERNGDTMTVASVEAAK